MNVQLLISNVRDLFGSGPLHDLAEVVTKKVNGLKGDDDDKQIGHVETTADFRQLFEKHRHYDVKQRDSFLFALLVLADYVFAVDQTADDKETSFIRRFLRENFGRFAEIQGKAILVSLSLERKRLCRRDPMLYLHMVGECSRQLTNIMTYDQRLQLLSFLVMIAKVSEGISEKESAALKDLSIYLKMRPEDLYAMFNFYDDSLDAAYRVLGTTEQATDEELRKAFDYMSAHFNPERMSIMGDDLERMARMKYVRILEARDRIWLARGMVMSAERLLE